MKKIFTVIIIMLMGTITNAQIENIKIDSNVTINRLYAGMLVTTATAIDSFHSTVDVNIRLGAMMTWKLNKAISLSGFGVYERSTAGQLDIATFYADIKASKNLLIRVGKSPTVGAFLHRAHPVSSSGHFETWTQAKVPGAAPAITLMYGQTKSMILAGVSQRAGGIEYQVGARFNKLKFSSVYQASNNQFATAVTYASDNFLNTTVWKQDESVANLLYYTFDPKRKISFFADMGYGYPKENKIIRTEIGFLKVATSKRVNGLLSVSYDAMTKKVNFYTFIYL